MVGFTVAQAGIEQENIKGFGIGSEATLVKYESAIKIPIPFMDKRLQIGDQHRLEHSGNLLKLEKVDSNSMHHLVLM
ncbi:hypothetical protein HFP64_19660 [Bacillus sp. AC79A.1]